MICKCLDFLPTDTLEESAVAIKEAVVEAATEALTAIPMQLAEKLKDPSMAFYAVYQEARHQGSTVLEAKRQATEKFMELLKEKKEDAKESMGEAKISTEGARDTAKKALEMGKKKALQAMRNGMNEQICGVVEGIVEDAGSAAVALILERVPALQVLGQQMIEEIANEKLLEYLMPSLEDKAGSIVTKLLGEGTEEEEEEEEEDEEGAMSPGDAWALLKETTAEPMEAKKDLVTFDADNELKVEKVPVITAQEMGAKGFYDAKTGNMEKGQVLALKKSRAQAQI